VRIKDDWESYHGGAYLADVARSICHQDGGKAVATTAKPAEPLVAHSPMPSAARPQEQKSASDRSTMVQFVSSSSEAEVRGDIAKLKAQLGPQIGEAQFSIQPAVVKGSKHYRGKLGPYLSRTEAEQICAKIVEFKFQCVLVNR
jgi:hypothetical protein